MPQHMGSLLARVQAVGSLDGVSHSRRLLRAEGPQREQAWGLQRALRTLQFVRGTSQGPCLPSLAPTGGGGGGVGLLQLHFSDAETEAEGSQAAV